MTSFDNISETTPNGCTAFWTAGQQLRAPSTRMSRSPFVWRVTSTNTPYSDTVSVMYYTNWVAGHSLSPSRRCV